MKEDTAEQGNNKRSEPSQEQLREERILAIRLAQATYPNVVNGISGEYYIGCEGGDAEAHTFTVKLVAGPVGNYPAIFGYENTFIPVNWLFKSIDHCRYMNGWRGSAQRGMLTFLQQPDVLGRTIDQVRAEKQAADVATNVSSLSGARLKRTLIAEAMPLSMDIVTKLGIYSFQGVTIQSTFGWQGNKVFVRNHGDNQVAKAFMEEDRYIFAKMIAETKIPEILPETVKEMLKLLRHALGIQASTKQTSV